MDPWHLPSGQLSPGKSHANERPISRKQGGRSKTQGCPLTSICRDPTIPTQEHTHHTHHAHTHTRHAHTHHTLCPYTYIPCTHIHSYTLSYTHTMHTHIHTMQPWLACNSLCKPGWPQSQSATYSSNSGVDSKWY